MSEQFESRLVLYFLKYTISLVNLLVVCVLEYVLPRYSHMFNNVMEDLYIVVFKL